MAGLERNYAVGKICESVIREHTALMDGLVPLLSWPWRTLGQSAAMAILEKIEKTTAKIGPIVKSSAQPPDANEAWKEWGFPDIQMVNGLFMRRAHDIELVSSWEIDDPDGYGICIDALGEIDKTGRPTKNNGNLILNATKSVTLLCGKNDSKSGISITQDKEIVIECDSGGTITIRNSRSKIEPCIRLQDEGISLSVGPRGILPGTPPEAEITLKTDSIKLRSTGMPASSN